MRPLRDAWDWTVKKVGDHPGASVGAVIGGTVGSLIGPAGTVAGAAAGGSLGNIFDQTPKKPEPDAKL